jgi:hypothetical protein
MINIKNIERKNIIYVLGVFIFLKYGLKDLNLIYLILISISIVYYIKNYMISNLVNGNNKMYVNSEVDTLLKKIEKYDNNNLFLKINKNFKKLNKYFNTKNKFLDRDVKDIYFLKGKILDYINSLNIAHNDKTIDNVYNNISDLINSNIKKYKKKNNIKNYLFSNIL